MNLENYLMVRKELMALLLAYVAKDAVLELFSWIFR